MLVLNHSVLCTYLLYIGIRQLPPSRLHLWALVQYMYFIVYTENGMWTEILYDYNTCVTWSFIDSVYRYIMHSVGSGLGRTLYKV